MPFPIVFLPFPIHLDKDWHPNFFGHFPYYTDNGVRYISYLYNIQDHTWRGERVRSWALRMRGEGVEGGQKHEKMAKISQKYVS